MGDLVREFGQAEAGVPRSSTDPEHAFAVRRSVCVEPEARRLYVRPVEVRAQRPEADVVPLARAVVDRLLETDVLAASEEEERAERGRGVGDVPDEGPRHAPGTLEAERIGPEPSRGRERMTQLFARSNEDQVHGISGKAIAGDGITGHMLALEELVAETHNPGKDDVRRDAVGRRHGEHEGHALIDFLEHHEDHEPDREGAEAEDDQALQEPHCRGHGSGGQGFGAIPSRRGTIDPSICPGVVEGAKRCTTSPPRSTRNLVKFHFTAAVPAIPGLALLRWRYRGCVPGPFTSIFANIGNVTS